MRREGGTPGLAGVDEVFKDGAWEGRRVLSSARERLGKCSATGSRGRSIAAASAFTTPGQKGVRNFVESFWCQGKGETHGSSTAPVS